ncbi:MAG: hypothetical protein AAB656_04720 [Patescibacteria group bacterium]
MNASDSATLKFIADASGAFFGGFFAFIFGLVTYYWTRWVERQKKDYDAMVKLEGVLNEDLNVFSKNDYLIKGSIKTLTMGGVTYNILRKYRLVEDIELSFLDLELINKYFEYRDSINSLNNDFEVANKANDILREVALGGKASTAAVKYNSQIMITNLAAINNMASVIDEETKLLLCVIRIKIKTDQPGLFGVHRLFWHPHKPTKQKIARELIQLEKEISETKEASKKLISKSQKKSR